MHCKKKKSEKMKNKIQMFSFTFEKNHQNIVKIQ